MNIITNDYSLSQQNNIYNAMAAGIASKLFEMRKPTIRECFRGFKNVEHRLECVTKVHGI